MQFSWIFWVWKVVFSYHIEQWFLYQKGNKEDALLALSGPYLQAPCKSSRSWTSWFKFETVVFPLWPASCGRIPDICIHPPSIVSLSANLTLPNIYAYVVYTYWYIHIVAASTLAKPLSGVSGLLPTLVFTFLIIIQNWLRKSAIFFENPKFFCLNPFPDQDRDNKSLHPFRRR